MQCLPDHVNTLRGRRATARVERCQLVVAPENAADCLIALCNQGLHIRDL
jgi:hypothetical protein